MITIPEGEPYTPAEHLVSGSVFTSEQLVTQFEDFRKNLPYASTAPELVFERLVANFNKYFDIVLESERQKYSGELDGLEKELAELKLTGVTIKELGQTTGCEKTPKKSSGGSLKSEIQETPPTAARSNPTIGVFDTQEIRPWDETWKKTSKTVSFSRPYPNPPCIAIGLTAVDIDRHSGSYARIGVMPFASNIYKERFEINVDSLLDTKLFSASCAWLEIEADDPDFQAGSYNIEEDNSSNYRPAQNTQKVTFPRSYDSIPVVVVWLKKLDMANNRNWRVKTFASDITATGFTIHIDTWSDSFLITAEATWVAYPSGKPGVYSGQFSTLDVRPSDKPQLSNGGYEKFSSGVFSAPPRVLLAINSLEIDQSRNMRLSLKASTVSEAGMMWHLDAWWDTILYSAGASYIALS